MTPVVRWLFVCCVMIAAMVLLGGITRLTGSGLSIVDWRPLGGILPPLTDDDWWAAFRAYRETPEFRRLNFWMGLADFKAIYWIEYLHRAAGRLTGVVFLVPFAWFLIRRRLGRRLAGKLAVAFILGGLQGVLGWFMVSSGLVDRPSVSQYRLAAHLGLALFLFGYLLWIALDLSRTAQAWAACGAARRLRAHALLVLAWAYFTAITGAFVAGLDAGAIYNSFPLMGGRITPAEMFDLRPWVRNLFENAATVQFNHRAAGLFLAACALAFWLRVVRARVGGRLRRSADALAAVILAQLALGIGTLLTGADIVLAAAHQAGAVLVIALAIATAHGLRAGA